MAQLLVFTRDNTHPDPAEDYKEFKIGDVVAVADDAHVWGAAELAYPFRVVSVVGLRSAYSHLLKPEPATLRDIYPRSLLQVRRLRYAFGLDFKKNSGRVRRMRKHTISASNIISQKVTEAV